MNDETEKTVAMEGEEALEPNDTMAPSSPAAEGQGELDPEQIDALRAKASKADEYWERLVRVSADFDNFKKRAARERQEGIKFANVALLEKLLPILDNLDMALVAANTARADAGDALKTGVNMIFSQLRNVLAEAGLEEVDATGQVFDPQWHEAVSQQPSAEVPEGQVLQQLRKGYKFKDRLLRPSTVVVAKPPSA